MRLFHLSLSQALTPFKNPHCEPGPEWEKGLDTQRYTIDAS